MTEKTDKICPKCEGENVVYCDDSFSHEFGTEVIQYYICEDCDNDWDCDNGDEY